MLKFLLNHSIIIVGLLATILLIRSKLKEYLLKKDLDKAQFLSVLRQKTNEVGQFLFPKIFASIIVTLVISPVSFREIWVNDVYHVVFLTSILLNRVELYLNSLFQ